MPRLSAHILVTAVFALTAAGAAAQDLVITNARIVVGSGATIDRGSIVVRSGRIVSVAPGAPAPGSGQTIDAKGMTALPGFIDAHRHIMGGNDAQWFKEQSVPRMQEFLDAGYTTLMSGGGPVPGILDLKKREQARRPHQRARSRSSNGECAALTIV
jgi:N-acyl-D-aspartate/D-glutamate deacylase